MGKKIRDYLVSLIVGILLSTLGQHLYNAYQRYEFLNRSDKQQLIQTLYGVKDNYANFLLYHDSSSNFNSRRKEKFANLPVKNGYLIILNNPSFRNYLSPGFFSNTISFTRRLIKYTDEYKAAPNDSSKLHVMNEVTLEMRDQLTKVTTEIAYLENMDK